jgi:hypothetical protein
MLERMKLLYTRQAEIVATLYAAWNNLLLDGQQPNDEAIVSEAREQWHKDKLKPELDFSIWDEQKDRYFSAIQAGLDDYEPIKELVRQVLHDA